jgi:DNA-binding NarL/FixJ family response regulator
MTEAGMLETLVAQPRPAAPSLRLVGSARRPLSERERQVLVLVADGLSTREVARRLNYSERTIKHVLQDLGERLHLRNRTHAVAYAIRAGWI